MHDLLELLIGPHQSADALTWLQMSMRTMVVFAVGVVLVRVADRRFLGHNAGFDVLLAVVLGSVLSRAINGQAPFFKTLGAAALLVVIHRLVASAACRWPAISRWTKGRPVTLVQDGEVQSSAMRRMDLTAEDLEENLRLNGNVTRPADVQEARLERNGQISVVKQRPPG